MNYILFFAILNLILVSRLRFTMRDEGITKKQDLFIIAAIPLLVLPFLSLSTGWFLLAGFLIVVRPVIIYLLEKTDGNLNRNRIVTLAVNLVVVGLLTSPLTHLQQAGWVYGAENMLFEIFIPGGDPAIFSWYMLHIFLFGFLMILNEINIVIRFALEKLELAPLSTKHSEINEQQFRTGRVIGFLERIFVFLFVLLNQYTAIGFIIAAKGIVRYPDFGKKSFTEYILIGTLLSVLLAMFVAFIVLLFIW